MFRQSIMLILMALLTFSSTLAADNQELFNAIESNNSTLVRSIVGKDKNALTHIHRKSKNMPLHYAIRLEKPELVRLLVELGADVNKNDKSSISGLSPLYYAILKKNEELATFLIDKGAHTYEHNEFGNLLILACYRNLTGLCRRFIESGKFNLNKKASKNHFAALHYAVKAENQELVRLLLEKGADVNLFGEANTTPLHIACKKNNTEIAMCLLEKGARANVYELESVDHLSTYSGSYNRRFGHGPLHYAAENGNLRLVQLLVGAGADVNARSMDESSPLHFAAYGGHDDVIRFLVEKGADINSRGKVGKETPLSRAVYKKRKSSIALIKSLGGKK